MQTVETLNEGLKRAYTLTISAKDIDARVDSEVANIAPQVRMPGFRPGKVPANLIRKMHGERLQADALNSSIQEGVQKVIADNKLRPAMQPAVELDEGFAFGKDAEVKISLEVLPEIAAPKVEELGLKLGGADHEFHLVKDAGPKLLKTIEEPPLEVPQAIQDATAGKHVVERLKSLYAITHLRGRLHITLRDLRSALAYMLVGTRDCDEIHDLYKKGQDRKSVV